MTAIRKNIWCRCSMVTFARPFDDRTAGSHRATNIETEIKRDAMNMSLTVANGGHRRGRPARKIAIVMAKPILTHPVTSNKGKFSCA